MAEPEIPNIMELLEKVPHMEESAKENEQRLIEMHAMLTWLVNHHPDAKEVKKGKEAKQK